MNLIAATPSAGTTPALGRGGIVQPLSRPTAYISVNTAGAVPVTD